MLREFDKYRKNDGTIDLNLLPKTSLLEPQKDINYSFLYNGEEYLFKKEHYSGEALVEIVNELIMNSLGLDNAQYDTATYNGMMGCITKNFIKQDSVFYNGFDFLKKYYPNGENDIYDYVVALLIAGMPINDIKREIQKMLKNHIMDIFTFQKDRSNSNLGFLVNEAAITVAPKYDNGYSFLYSQNRIDHQKFVNSSYYRRREKLLENAYLYHTILPKYDVLNNITEFWRAAKNRNISEMSHEKMNRAQYVLNNGIGLTPDEVYQMIRKQIDLIWPFIEKTGSINLDDIFYIMSESEINMPEQKKKLIKKVYDTTQGMFWEGEISSHRR